MMLAMVCNVEAVVFLTGDENRNATAKMRANVFIFDPH